MKTVWTTAPEVYDGLSTHTVLPSVGRNESGQTVRVVEMDDVDFEWQTGRYRSGLYAARLHDEAHELFLSGL